MDDVKIIDVIRFKSYDNIWTNGKIYIYPDKIIINKLDCYCYIEYRTYDCNESQSLLRELKNLKILERCLNKRQKRKYKHLIKQIKNMKNGYHYEYMSLHTQAQLSPNSLLGLIPREIWINHVVPHIKGEFKSIKHK